MSTTAAVYELAPLSFRALEELLDRAEREERTLSAERRLLHDQIDVLQAVTPRFPERHGTELASLSRRERELSAERLELHRQIAELRLEKHRRRDALRAPLRAVE